jgi:hypothetical protein
MLLEQGVLCLVFGVWCFVFGVWCFVFGDLCWVIGDWQNEIAKNIREKRNTKH